MATTTKRKDEKPITIGSGTVYIAEFTGETVPDHATLCVDENRLAYVKGGATLNYSKEVNTVSDDLGLTKKTITTAEEATLAMGLVGWVGTTLSKLISTARVTEDDQKKMRKVKIGGIANDNGKRYALCFHHHDAADGDCWWTMVGTNTAGFELAYQPDTESAVNPTFTAEPMDGEGTLIIYEEEIG